ncbi:MAG: hypothetical protein IJ620_03260 [Bacteroidales bacterium]|nr:hypothetical protein [Bacteroidales bacterium]
MPTIKEILEIERSKPDNRIVLFEEGSFMKAYERSACFLSIMYRFKLNVREYKNIGETILSAGFPASTMAQRFPHAVVSNGWCMVQVPLLPF